MVLDNIDLDINEGDVIGIIGPSGTGKSTLLRCIDLLEQPDKGYIRIGNFEGDLTKLNKKQVIELRQKLAMVFQQFNLFYKKTALENVMEGLTVVKKMDKAEAEKIAVKNLKEVGMIDSAFHYPGLLSGGQQQRVAIARALAMQPELLLLDEPTSALDPELVGEVLDTINKIAKEGYTMLLVSHEMQFVRNVATRVIFLEHGKIVEDGTPQQVFENPKNQRTRDFLSKMNFGPAPEYVI